MNGTIHIICTDRYEEWFDGEDVKIVIKDGYRAMTNGLGATIVFKDSTQLRFDNAFYVEIIDAKPKAAEVVPDEESEQKTKEPDYLSDRVNYELSNEIDRLDIAELNAKKKEHPNRFYCRKGNAVRFLNACKDNKIETVGQLLKLGRIRFEMCRNIGNCCGEAVSQALENLYGIKTW